MAADHDEFKNGLLAIDANAVVQRVLMAIIGSDPGGSLAAEERISRTLATACRQVDQLLEDFTPAAAFAAFDRPGARTWRHDLFPEYKSTRSPPPPERLPAMRLFWKAMVERNILTVIADTAEADDLIDHGVRQWSADGGASVIATKDKDLMALAGPRTAIWDLGDKALRGEAWLHGKLGIRPDQVRSYLAMVGDSSDNIPGVAGIGPKMAAELLGAYASWPEILSAAPTMEGRKGALICKSAESGDLSYALAGLYVPEAQAFSISEARFKQAGVWAETVAAKASLRPRPA